MGKEENWQVVFDSNATRKAVVNTYTYDTQFALNESRVLYPSSINSGPVLDGVELFRSTLFKQLVDDLAPEGVSIQPTGNRAGVYSVGVNDVVMYFGHGENGNEVFFTTPTELDLDVDRVLDLGLREIPEMIDPNAHDKIAKIPDTSTAEVTYYREPKDNDGEKIKVFSLGEEKNIDALREFIYLSGKETRQVRIMIDTGRFAGFGLTVPHPSHASSRNFRFEYPTHETLPPELFAEFMKFHNAGRNVRVRRDVYARLFSRAMTRLSTISNLH